MASPLVSVLLPVYNGADYLRNSVTSILRQTYHNFELIVIDDGSNDGSSSVLDEFDDSRVRFYTQRNRGLSYTLNRALRIARGRYLARQDQDDIAFANRLEAQVSFLNRHPHVAALGGAMVVIDKSGTPTGSLMRFPESNEAIKKVILLRSCIAHPTVIMRKDAVEAVGGYRKSVVDAEDYDLWLRLSEHYELANLPRPVIYYRIHESQMSLGHIEQQVLSTLAAQVAAKMRRSGAPDPLDDIQAIDSILLTRLGVSADSVSRALLTNYNWWAAHMLHFKDVLVARKLLEKAKAISSDYLEHFAASYGYNFGEHELDTLLDGLALQKGLDRTMASYYMGCANRYLSTMRPLACARMIIRACAASPRLAARLLIQALSSSFRA
jgi:glycosyltransferase involved in cell wall biosynthesis